MHLRRNVRRYAISFLRGRSPGSSIAAKPRSGVPRNSGGGASAPSTGRARSGCRFGPGAVELRIGATGADQLFMRPLLGDPAVLEDHDLAGAADGGEAGGGGGRGAGGGGGRRGGA